MICIPLLWLGYKGAREMADEYSEKALEKSDWVVIFLIALGCVVHSVYHFVPLFHIHYRGLMQIEISSIKLIEIIFVAFYIMFCVIITIQSLRVKNVLLHANRFFNPLLWMVFVVIVFIITPKYGGFLAVSAFNMSIGFYFIGISVNRKKVM